MPQGRKNRGTTLFIPERSGIPSAPNRAYADNGAIRVSLLAAAFTRPTREPDRHDPETDLHQPSALCVP